MSEVLDENWPEMLARMETALKTAIFVSIDNEFSGLRDANKEDISLFDTNHLRYLKLRNHISEFLVVQIGISIFSYDAEGNSYTCEVFTVYLFPGTTGRKDASLKFQASSIEFLTRYDFDFNKMMHHGVTFMSLAEMEKLRALMQTDCFVEQQKMQLSVDILETFKSISSEVTSWAVGAKDREEKSFPCPPTLFPYLLQRDIRKANPDVWTRLRDNNIIVNKVGPKLRKELEEEFVEKEDKEAFEHLIGFAKFFSLLVKSDVPIVGHNLLLDLMHIFQQFIEPLPESYKLFKYKLLQNFPMIFDTKLMSMEIKRKIEINDGWDSDLQRLYNYLISGRCNNFAPGAPKISTPFEEQSEDAISGSGDHKQTKMKAHFHDAGWDSFCAGYIFIRLAHISAVFDEAVKNEDKITEFNLTWDDLLKSAQPMQNKVHIALGRSNHISLSEHDKEASWNHIVHLQLKNSKCLTFEEIEETFVQFGSIDIKMIDSKRALLANPTPECLREILKFCKNHPAFRAERYSRLKHTPVGRNAIWAGIFTAFASGTFLLYSAC